MKTTKTFISNQFNELLETQIKWEMGKNTYPTIIFVSGFGMDLHENANSFDEIAEKLVNKGFLTVQFSFAGRGKSQGDYSETSAIRQAKELSDILSAVGKHQLVDEKKIGIISQSFGTASAILSFPLPIRSFISICGVVHPFDGLKKVFEQRGVIIDFSGKTVLPRSDGSKTIVGPQFWRDIEKIDLPKTLSKFNYPFLAIHGALDNKIEEEESRQLFESCNSKTKNLKIFPKGDHGITDVDKKTRSEFISTIIKWSENTLKK